MRLSRYSAWIGIGFGLLGLTMTGLARAGESVGKIQFETAVPAEQIESFKHDRAMFAAIQIPESNTELQSLLGTNSNSTLALNQWLEDRVRVVVTEKFDEAADEDKYYPTLQKHYRYENPTDQPRQESVDPKLNIQTHGQGVIHRLMANLGLSIYDRAKNAQALWGIKINGVGTLRVKSPRVGVIQIGDALFDPTYQVNARQPGSIANSIARIGTFFHEARHSDGHGESLGFYHAVCPPGHPLAGQLACDRSTNGAYSVQANLLKAMTEACPTCRQSEREALRLQYIEYFGRVLPTELDGKTPTVAWDPTPEGLR